MHAGAINPFAVVIFIARDVPFEFPQITQKITTEETSLVCCRQLEDIAMQQTIKAFLTKLFLLYGTILLYVFIKHFYSMQTEIEIGGYFTFKIIHMLN